MVDTPRKTFPELQALSAPVVDSDVLAVYRSPGPAKRTTASVLGTYVNTVIGTAFTRTLLATASNSAFLTALGQIASSFVDFLQAGVGAITRTVQDRLREEVSVKDFGAVGNGTTDDTTAISNALTTGKDVTLPAGDYKITGPLTLATAHQRIRTLPGAIIYPYHDGDVIRVTGGYSCVDCYINGTNQPRTGTAGGAIVVGYAGANPLSVNLGQSRIVDFKGSGVIWEQGPRLVMDNVVIQNIYRDNTGNVTDGRGSNTDGHGFVGTAAYDDNNHGSIGGHIIRAYGIGYYIRKFDTATTTQNNLDSRQHIFVNAKAFGCKRNYLIETTGNDGTVFSEFDPSAIVGTNQHSEFPSCAVGNFITWVGDVSTFGGLIVGTPAQNMFVGYTSFNQLRFAPLLAKDIWVQNLAEGELGFIQPSARTFQSTIRGTAGDVTVTHALGTASKRTEIFPDRVQFAGATDPLVINSTKMGTVSVVVGSIGDGVQVNGQVTAATAGSGSGDTAFVTAAHPSGFGLVCSGACIDASGNVNFTLTNKQGTTQDYGTVTVRWVVMKHFA
jgi:hypothetical protein